MTAPFPQWYIRPVTVLPSSRINRPRSLPPVMRTTLAAVDIVAFGDRYRDADAQLRVRQVMYQLLVEAFAMTRLPWWDCHRGDRGDGVLTVALPDVNPDGFLDPLANHLHALLRRHNRHAAEASRLQLRLTMIIRWCMGVKLGSWEAGKRADA